MKISTKKIWLVYSPDEKMGFIPQVFLTSEDAHEFLCFNGDLLPLDVKEVDL